MSKLLNIVFENEDCIVIDKPSGMLSIPDREQSQKSLKDHLQDQYGSIFTVHRLDRDTSGLIIFAKNESAHKFLSAQFENREAGKQYLGLVYGTLEQSEGIWDAPIREHAYIKGKMMVHRDGKPSSTSYSLMDAAGPFSLVRFTIHTGRTHQIRVHAANAGHPIACDAIYGKPDPILLSAFKKKYKLSKSEESERPILQRLALHSHRLNLYLPDGNNLQVEAPLPKDIRALLQQLKKIHS